MNVQNKLETSDLKIHTTTAMREWLGWCGILAWMILLNYGYQMFVLDWESPVGSWYPFLFMILVALSMTTFGFVFGRNPDGLARIAFYTTPVAIVITAVFSFLPQPLGSVLYVVAPIFMAPALTRRAYGILRTSELSFRLLRYIVGFAASIVVVTALNFIVLPKDVVFIAIALLAVPAWIGIRRNAALPDSLPDTGAFKLSKRLAVLLAIAMFSLFWLNIMHVMIHMLVSTPGGNGADILFTVLSFILPPIAFLLYAFIGDKGYERIGFICGIALFLIGIQLTFLQSADFSTRLMLAVTEGLGGTYTQFFIMTFPIYFLVGSKRPVFIASLGIALCQILSALYWKINVWLPGIFREMGAPVLVSAAVSAIVFIVLVFILFERQREKSLAAALYALLHSDREDKSAESLSTDSEIQKMADIGFTEDEIKVAMLLIEGDTRHDITRKLHLTSEDTNKRMSAIRKKISGADDLDPTITAVVKKYGLTRRQTDMLRHIRDGMTNAEIAKVLSISEETVKGHMRNLKQKLSVGNKQEIAEWLEDYGKEQG